jgi:hypothetical protein
VVVSSPRAEAASLSFSAGAAKSSSSMRGEVVGFGESCGQRGDSDVRR